MTGYIYAIECNARIKIGFSEDPARRLNKIASDAPFPCELLGYWPGTVADELSVHDKFKSVRLHGEWFAATVDLMEFIAAVSVQKAPPSKQHKLAAPPVGAEDIENWPAIIKRIQYRMDWTQRDMCRETGLHQSMLSKWRSGKHGPSKAARVLLRRMLENAEAVS